ncbi:ergothioneine biosynthesis protein EgtB [Oxalobacteraceae bacterium GrIS 2.11]
MNVSYTKNQQFFSERRVDGGVASRQFAEAYQSVRQQSINLTVTLSVEDMAVQSSPDSCPVKWHLAQTTWFFEKYLLGKYVKDYLPFHPAFNLIFGPSGHFPRDLLNIITRPTLSVIRTYRTHVDNAVLALLKNLPEEAYSILELGLQKEMQTQERMLVDIKNLLGSNPFHPAYINKPLIPAEKVGTLKMLELRGGMAEIGHPGLTFCFENELPKHRVYLNPFAVADRKITNAEYLAFVNADGYSETRWWLDEGVQWRKKEHIKAPLYWRKIDGNWHEYTLHGLVPLDPNRPVCHISFFEADAFARFSGARLPTEFEWEFAANSIIPDLPGMPELINSGGEKPTDDVFLHPSGARAVNGLKQFFSDAWEWTSSSYAPYPGVKSRNDDAIDNHERQMVNQYVLRGGSVATPNGHSRITYRKFAATMERHQFTGIRLARSIY